MSRVPNPSAMLEMALKYQGSDAGRLALADLRFCLRELEHLRALHAPFAVTIDEMAAAWWDTHDREGRDETLASLNAILAARAIAREEGRAL